MNNVLNMTCGDACCVPATTEQLQGRHYASVGYLYNRGDVLIFFKKKC